MRSFSDRQAPYWVKIWPILYYWDIREHRTVSLQITNRWEIQYRIVFLIFLHFLEKQQQQQQFPTSIPTSSGAKLFLGFLLCLDWQYLRDISGSQVSSCTPRMPLLPRPAFPRLAAIFSCRGWAAILCRCFPLTVPLPLSLLPSLGNSLRESAYYKCP